MTQAQETKQDFKAGLDGVVAGESRICLIDGNAQKLFYRGYNVADLIVHSCFEETAYLLLKGQLPKSAELVSFKASIQSALTIDPAVCELATKLPKGTDKMDALRSLVSFAQHFDPDSKDNSTEANFRKATRLIAQTLSIAAQLPALAEGKKPLAPNPAFSLAQNFLYQLLGRDPSAAEAKIFDQCLILHADHGFNASTFTARIVAATLSDIHSSVTAAIGALKGPLHGGANQEVMKLIDSIGSLNKVESHMQEMFATGKKVPGFGHRVYRNCEDPRAVLLRASAEELSKAKGNHDLLDISQAIRKAVTEHSESRSKPIYPNVDFYSASVYSLLEIPTDLFTPIFACSRMAGWCAHFIEQHENNRLIRPEELYIGERDLAYAPIENR